LYSCLGEPLAIRSAGDPCKKLLAPINCSRFPREAFGHNFNVSCTLFILCPGFLIALPGATGPTSGCFPADAQRHGHMAGGYQSWLQPPHVGVIVQDRYEIRREDQSGSFVPVSVAPDQMSATIKIAALASERPGCYVMLDKLTEWASFVFRSPRRHPTA